jgi:hypothetical protein
MLISICSVRLSSNKNVKVGADAFGITFATIETDSVSSCHFVLIDGQINKEPFGYLSHSSREPQDDDPKETLIKLFQTILDNIDRYNKFVTVYYCNVYLDSFYSLFFDYSFVLLISSTSCIHFDFFFSLSSINPCASFYFSLCFYVHIYTLVV